MKYINKRNSSLLLQLIGSSPDISVHLFYVLINYLKLLELFVAIVFYIFASDTSPLGAVVATVTNWRAYQDLNRYRGFVCKYFVQ